MEPAGIARTTGSPGNRPRRDWPESQKTTRGGPSSFCVISASDWEREPIAIRVKTIRHWREQRPLASLLC